MTVNGWMRLKLRVVARKISLVAESKPQALKRDPNPRSGGTSELVPFPFTGTFLFPDLFVS